MSRFALKAAALAKKGAVTAMAVGALTAGGTVAAAPASAATGFDRCPHGYFCLFSQEFGQGTMAYFSWGSPDLAAQGLPNGYSSAWNRSGNIVHGYAGLNYSSWHLTTMDPYEAPRSVVYDSERVHSIRAV
ncbi:hypothetical protein GCM10027570_14750 [Streptomonospora sediminis]